MSVAAMKVQIRSASVTGTMAITLSEQVCSCQLENLLSPDEIISRRVCYCRLIECLWFPVAQLADHEMSTRSIIIRSRKLLPIALLNNSTWRPTTSSLFIWSFTVVLVKMCRSARSFKMMHAHNMFLRLFYQCCSRMFAALSCTHRLVLPSLYSFWGNPFFRTLCGLFTKG